VRLSGRLSLARADRLILAVHGLGGSAESLYLRTLAAAAERAGWSILRLNLRGADRRGEDFYHAGLTADLRGALASSALQGFADVAIVGYSLGAHTALRYATEAMDRRVRAVVAVCPPLDLAAGQRALDRWGARIYRHYVLGHVKEIYREVAARRAVPVPVGRAEGIQTLWDWDEIVIAARYGFAGAADYYARASVAPRLTRLAVPALVVASPDDPMVPAPGVRPFLDPPPPGMRVHWPRRSGHVAFSRRLDLGYGGEKGLAGQLVAWLERQIG
jgi:predicted alpha/beta-fold hydrolase